LIVHNQYSRPSGEENAVRALADLLTRRGNEVSWFLKSSADIPDTLAGKAGAFFSGIFSAKARAQMAQRLGEGESPDIVQVQNLFPLFSPSILKPCRQRRLPVVMRCPNYRIFCPNGLHLSHGQLCERCLGGNEWWCALRNCTDNVPKSIGYALRGMWARRSRAFLDNVTVFVVLSEFQRQRFIAGGIPAQRIALLYNLAPEGGAETACQPGQGQSISIVGRLSPEKGLDQFVKAARALPEQFFEVAGDYSDMPELVRNAPPNVKFHGFLAGKELDEFYCRTKIYVSCSVCFEGFPNVITKAMIGAKPVIAPRIGSLPEIVTDNETGLLYEPGNVRELVEKIRALCNRPDLCAAMGAAGRHKAQTQYGQENVYGQLIALYSQAIELARRDT
jgi:glycosyltransferase involved in cell wall biosynthesis